MAKTDISWTDMVWNPVRGCSLVSAGCANCYAMKQAHRFSGKGQSYEGLTEIGPQGPRWSGTIRLVPEALEMPLHWKKPRRVFVNSMSDLFHENIPEPFILRVLTVIWRARHHTFQVLTKRPERMRDIMTRSYQSCACDPYKNLWLGVSVEDQQTADERIPILLQTPAAVRWISAEPLLDEIYVSHSTLLMNIDWVVVGGESGPGARPCGVAWIRSIKDQCQAASVPVFIKQLGARPLADIPELDRWSRTRLDEDGFLHFKDKKGGDPAEWPSDLRVREWPR